MRKSFADILSDMSDKRGKKFAAKLPTWAAAGCRVPSGLSLEQCSSEAAASYKAGLVGRAGRLADLTGGMGVDSSAFSRICGEVFYYERDTTLAEAAEENFVRLGIGNIHVCNTEIDAGTVLPECDWIYLDPARRAADGTGRKVFLLEDCSPNILELLPALLAKAPHIMVKLSPMADITMLSEKLPGIREIHVAGLDGEVKELLCIIGRESGGAPRITAVDPGSGIPAIAFTKEEEESARMLLSSVPAAGQIIFDPSPVITKAGCFRILCARHGMRKLDRFTHLYVCDSICTDVPGRNFEVLETAPLCKTALKDLAARFPGADVTARNIPMDSGELKKRLESTKKPAAQTAGIHIFGITASGERTLLVTRRIGPSL